MAETLPSSLRTPDCYVQTLQPPICVFIKLEVINGITSAILKGSQLEDIKSSFCVGFIENIRERRLFNGSGCHVWSHNAINFCDSRACCPAFPLACAEGISSHQIMALPGWLWVRCPGLSVPRESTGISSGFAVLRFASICHWKKNTRSQLLEWWRPRHCHACPLWARNIPGLSCECQVSSAKWKTKILVVISLDD